MKQLSYHSLMLFFVLGFFNAYINAEFVAVPGTPVWDLIAELGYETNTVLSTLGVIESLVENQSNCCSEIAVIDSKINVVESLVAHPINCCSEVTVIDSKIDVITSLIENAVHCCSEVAIIDSKVDVLESLLESAGFRVSNQPFVSIYGDQISENRLDNISIQFQYGIPATTVQSYTQGGGTITTANSAAVLSTAASATSIAQLQTTDTIGYRSGHEVYAYFTVAFTGAFAATSSQFIGPIDYQNGFAIGFDGPTFGITQRTNTVNTFIPQSSFNGDKLNGTGGGSSTCGFIYNPTLLNVFRIGYGYLGSSVIKFQIMSSKGIWITFHTIQYPNSSATPSIYQPFLPITARVENIAGTSVLSMSTVSWNAGIVGSPSTASYRYHQVDTVVTPTSNDETHIITIQNKLVFNNQRNIIRVRCAGFYYGVTSSTIVCTFRLRKNATVTGTSYSDVDANNSVVQTSTAGTYTTGTGTSTMICPYRVVTTGIIPDAPFIPDVYNIYLLPGDSLTLTTTGGSGIVQTGVIMWEEQF